MDSASFITVGIACTIAAIVGGGFKGMGVEIPVIHTLRRQLVLAAVGLTLISIGGIEKWTISHPGVDPNGELEAGLAAYDRRDFVEAIQHLEKSSGTNNPEAQYHYGAMLFHGEGVLPNQKKGFDWLLKSAKQGYAPAQASIADALWSGKGTALDKDEARRWAKLSANQRDVYGLYMHARMTENESEQRQLLNQAAERGYAPAQCLLGMLLENQIKNSFKNGPVAVGNFPECNVLYRNAAMQGHPTAQLKLAQYMRSIAGNESNNADLREEAYIWYSRALRGHGPVDWALTQEALTIAEQGRASLEKELPPQVVIYLRSTRDGFIPVPQMPYRHGNE